MRSSTGINSPSRSQNRRLARNKQPEARNHVKSTIRSGCIRVIERDLCIAKAENVSRRFHYLCSPWSREGVCRQSRTRIDVA